MYHYLIILHISYISYHWLKCRTSICHDNPTTCRCVTTLSFYTFRIFFTIEIVVNQHVSVVILVVQTAIICHGVSAIIYIYIHTFVHAYTHTLTHTHIYTHTYLRTYIYTYTHICTRMLTHTHTLMHSYIPTYIHTYTQTYTRHAVDGT